MSYHRVLGMPLRTGGVIGMNHLDYVPDAYARRAPPLTHCTQHDARYVGQYESDTQQLGESGDGLGGILAVL